ncbi:MAG: DUF5666 domain-containing protein [Candidatus Limnocylindrales bacterium]
MHIPTWRLVLTGGAITILAVAGIGFVAASSATVAPAANVAAADPTKGPDASPRVKGDKPTARDGARGLRLLKAGRHLVHGVVTVTDRDGNLVTLQFDHGTVQSIGSGSITIAEAGGGTVTVSTGDATKVHLGRQAGTLGDVKVGAEVFVQSRINGGTTLAKRILVVVPKT